MAISVGQIALDLVINQNQFQRQMTGITGLAKKAGITLAAAFGTKQLIDFGRKCLELGSDLAEVQNVVDVTFPSMSAQVDGFAKSAAQSFGLSETMAKQFTGTFGAMAKAFGFTEKQAYDMGSALTSLAGDVASFYNLSQEEAYTKLKSVFTGETESLKDLGVVMTQSALDAYALANGFGKTVAQMTEAEKVALRYAFVQEQLSAAQGDFARTSDSWSNQIKILNLQLDSLKATIGQGLINLFTPIIKTVNVLIGKLATAANVFKAFTELIMGKNSSSASQVSDMSQAAASAGTGMEDAAQSADNMTASANKAGNAARKAAKQMRSLMGFDKISKLSSYSDSDTNASAGSGAGDSSGSTVDFGTVAQGETIIDKTNDKLTKLFENIKKYADPTLASLRRLWNEGLAKLGEFTGNALKDFYNDFLVPVAKWTLGEGLPKFINVLNDGLGKVNFGKIQTALQKLWEVLAPFAIRVGEGLLWFWEQVLVPVGTWKASEVVPRFLDTLRIALETCANVLDALQPLFQWFWKEILKPLAKWTGRTFLSAWDKINGALEKFSGWCGKNPEIIRKIATTVLQFFAAWKGLELMSFIQQSGGVIGALNGIAKALFGTIAAKMTDKAETMYLTALYAKDFVVNLAQSTAALARQAAQFVINTALKIADTAAQLAMTAATVAWNAVCAVATVATTALGAAIAFLTSPIGLVIAAIAAVIAAGVLLYKNWDVIKEKALKIWGAIRDWFGRMCKSVGEFFSGLWKGIKETFSGVGNWFKEKFNAAYSKATGAFSKAKTFFGDIWKGIKNSFGNITEWFREKFSAAWEAVKKVFSSGGRIFEGIKDGILSSLKSVINGLIRGINNVIAIPFNSINSALNALKNWSVRFGPYELIRPFSWLPSIGTPQIPQLAEGGFVRKNTPQLAMIGDNRHQGEVVAPEDKLREMAMEAVRAVSGNGITRDDLENIINRAVMRIISALSEMGFYLDGTQIARANRAAQEIMDIRYSTIGVE